jgi:hypothetical protein
VDLLKLLMKRSPKMVKHLSQGKRGGSSPLGKEIHIRQCFALASVLLIKRDLDSMYAWIFVILIKK